jgi:hypothetical protein
MTGDAVRENGGGQLLAIYGNSLPKALMAIYPEYNWDPGNFKKSPKNYWKDANHQRKFFDSIAESLDIKSPEQWVRISQAEVKQRGGSTIIGRYYGGSLYKTLKAIYPEHDWDLLKKSKSTGIFWNDPQNQRKCFDWVAKQLNIEHLDQWYKVTASDLYKKGGGTALSIIKTYYANSFSNALQVQTLS